MTILLAWQAGGVSRLSDLLRQLRVQNEALAQEIEREVQALTDRRAFGLNFERHAPEAVELPGRMIRRGDKVRVLSPRRGGGLEDESEMWRVVSIDRHAGTASLTQHEDATTRTATLDDLVVVAGFRDPIYPGLVSTGAVIRDAPKASHCVINAENYHALQTLLFTHRGQVDCIYIDPPYNTGNGGWIYNDRYVSDDDAYKHSKWLAYMERRLLVAKELLKPTGVIVVAIGDEEHHRLRMLLDQVFDSMNFIANVTWQGSGKNDAKYTAGGVDYMLMYARDTDALVASGKVWREPKPGIEIAMDLASTAWTESKHDAAEATRLYRKELRKVRGELEPAVFRYDQIDKKGQVFRADNLTSPTPRPNLMYEVIHPETGAPVPTPRNGWRYSRESMSSLIAQDRVLFGKDETSAPAYKRLLTEQSERVPYATFVQARMPGPKHLEAVLGDQRFPNPKDYRVLARWLGAIAPADGIVLDFFAGSGSTAEAVMHLNEQDGGSRRCILVTNNEVSAKDARALRAAGYRRGDAAWEARGVCEYVTKPRLSTVVSGQRVDGSTFSAGMNQNIEFFDLTYEAPLRVASNREFAKIAPLLWMRAGSRGRRIDDVSAGWDVADTYGVLADLDQSETFLKAVASAPAGLSVVYVVTDEDRLFESIAQELPDSIEPVRLYEAYLRNFEFESGRGGL